MGDGEGEEPFRINDLPVEIRARIFNMLGQFCISDLRLVSSQWSKEIDEYYEYSLNIYDTTVSLSQIHKLRCRECTIWKLTREINTELFKHPSYLKVLKIYGPTSSLNLKRLIATSENLEHLTFSRRANYPWALNVQDTPQLVHMKKLKYLRLNSEEHLLINKSQDLPPTGDLEQLQKQQQIKLPFMDCTFPVLRTFGILKRFPASQYTYFLTPILRFISRHWSTLKNLECDLIPLTCYKMAGGSINREDGLNLGQNNALKPQEIDLESLCKLRLNSCDISTVGGEEDVCIWEAILQSQTSLKELRFDWIIVEDGAALLQRRNRVGFPWSILRTPIENCAKSLVNVELSNISMIEHVNGERVIRPFDLSIFKYCNCLKILKLNCKENSNSILAGGEAEEEEEELGNQEDLLELNLMPIVGHQPLQQQISLSPLLINTIDLPSGIEQLELYKFLIRTCDLQVLPQRCPELRKLFLNTCGTTGDFGVSANVIRGIGALTKLKFLEIVEFNDESPEERYELEQVFQILGKPYEGQETWLEYDNGSSNAHDSLKLLLLGPSQNQEL